jgi:hypothetical protein
LTKKNITNLRHGFFHIVIYYHVLELVLGRELSLGGLQTPLNYFL